MFPGRLGGGISGRFSSRDGYGDRFDDRFFRMYNFFLFQPMRYIHLLILQHP